MVSGTGWTWSDDISQVRHDSACRSVACRGGIDTMLISCTLLLPVTYAVHVFSCRPLAKSRVNLGLFVVLAYLLQEERVLLGGQHSTSRVSRTCAETTLSDLRPCLRVPAHSQISFLGSCPDCAAMHPDILTGRVAM